MCPRCSELGRTPVSVEIARSDVGGVRVRSTAVMVCLRCADVLWHRLQKVVGPLVRQPQGAG
jgi:hypothetical protein